MGQSVSLAKVCQKLLQNIIYIRKIWVDTNLSIGGSSIGHNIVVFSMKSLISQVLQVRLELRIGQVTQLTILALLVWRRLWGETSHSDPPETKGLLNSI